MKNFQIASDREMRLGASEIVVWHKKFSLQFSTAIQKSLAFYEKMLARKEKSCIA